MKNFLPALLLALLGCSTSSYRYLFSPSPAEVLIQPQPDSPVARALITILEGRKADGGARMHLRLRIENRDDAAVRLDPSSLQLVGSDLAEFGPAQIDPDVSEVPPGGVHTYDIWFPFPPTLSLSAPNLDGLNLTWRLDNAGGAAEVSTTFQRRVEDDYPTEPRVTWSFGVGYYRSSR
jgi:hypothetical protein